MNQPDQRLMLVDHDPYTSGVLVDELLQRGFENIRIVSDFLELPATLANNPPDVLVFNYHYDHPETLLACSNARTLAPKAAIVAIVSPGPTIKKLRAWARQNNFIDLIIEKPLSDERFYSAVREMLNIKAAARQMETWVCACSPPNLRMHDRNIHDGIFQADVHCATTPSRRVYARVIRKKLRWDNATGA